MPPKENQFEVRSCSPLPPNLKYTRQFYQSSIGQQLVAQIPWGHNILIFSKSKDTNEAFFYINETVENGWSRDVLALQLKTQLYQRQRPYCEHALTIGYRGLLTEIIQIIGRQTEQIILQIINHKLKIR
ncbi:MAG: DUF1016 family protein [Runella slithyformis]|nr:MAG: DUF1016 family protein [Runella slithyformis]TAF28312.1 MAG: DUF1016 family protein [Runella slithyformis]TAF49730.1 MAG: DUF1016 family protein [Runella slithyformis]TAF81912.1 MAG: DUF1016 family protein [Runella slithyformis]TAH15788.1 MAG: DUF1016 family protein [Runella slithyformis]